jgi:hypothetical protein
MYNGLDEKQGNTYIIINTFHHFTLFVDDCTWKLKKLHHLDISSKTNYTKNVTMSMIAHYKLW